MKTEFQKGGFSFRQIKREGAVALFDRSKNGRTHFEVAIITAHGPYELVGVKFPAGESYPSSEQWGQKGWTYTTREEADERFRGEVESRGIAALTAA